MSHCHNHTQKMSNSSAHDHSGHNHGGHDHAAAMSDPKMAKAMEADMRKRFFIALALTIPIILYSSLAEKFFGLTLPRLISSPALPDGGVGLLSLALTSVVVFWAGSIFITGAYHSLKRKKLDMSVLIATGVLAAYIFSALTSIIALVSTVPSSMNGETFFEAAAMLVTFVLFGHWMEVRSRKGTSDALRALFDLVPPKAKIIRNGIEISVSSSEIKHGDIVFLRPGDKAPVDGEITDGETAMDESLITGESLPVSKKKGDKIIGGSINQTGVVKFRATQVGAETVLAHIIKMVEQAQNSKAPGQRIADKAASWLVVLAVGSGILTFFAWYWFAGSPLFTALTFAISAVVIACPDALGLATPTAVAVGTGIGAKHSILIKDAATLENLSKINAIVIDKTGTLTEGKPSVTDIIKFNGFSEEEVLRYGANVEMGSNHPIAKAILDEANKRKSSPKDIIEKFESFAGLGMKAYVNGKILLAGKAQLLRNNNIDLGDAEKTIEKLGEQGKTVSMIAVNEKLAGIIAVADVIKPTAKKTVAELENLDIETAMITGDNRKVAEVVGKEISIKRIFSEVLPQEKAGYVKKLQDEGKFVAMVGDGINDAPALAQADIGIAIGAGTDVALETGNVVLMRSDPLDIISAIRLSKATVKKMKQNLFWAAIYNVLAIPIAAGVLYQPLGISLRPEFAALLMSVSSIIVATNAVLLKKVEPKLKLQLV